MLIPIFQAIILGIVEGLTEFLPVSSTGHLIIVNQWIAFSETFTRLFDVIIQLGAILAVLVFFWSKLWPFGGEEAARKSVRSTWIKVIVAVIPAIIAGGLLGSVIEDALFKPWVVAIALIVGGVVLLFMEKMRAEKIQSVEGISLPRAFCVGLFQCLAMIPGTSRSAATIVGATLLGASRKSAVEFSFFLAIPTMVAASAYSMLKHGSSISGSELVLLAVGFVTAFIVASLAIKYMMKYVQNHDLKVFGYYRIILGALILIFFI